jgi:hypothetical protein
MTEVPLYSITYLPYPYADELTVEIFDNEDDAIERRYEMMADSVYAMIQRHEMAVGR